MKSVTEQLEDMHKGETPEQQAQQRRENVAIAKLKVAYATRGAVPKATGVIYRSPGHDQSQEIFDDGSVRNPYKVNREMSGRQRRKMRKATNRSMKARGLNARIEDVLKGRRVGTPERPQQTTGESPVPAADAGTPVAPSVSD